MTDLEMTKLCAAAMGVRIISHELDGDGLYKNANGTFGDRNYDPLHDDAQAMALVKKFAIETRKIERDGKWIWQTCNGYFWGQSDDLNRAIVECVAKMVATPTTDNAK